MGSCRRLLPSLEWAKLKDDTGEEWVTGQRYYCPCNARYKTSWGQVVVVTDSVGEKSYLKADVPEWDVEDVRAMKAEVDHSPATVKQLMDKFTAIPPAISDVVKEEKTGEWADDTYKYVISRDVLDEMPEFKWAEILTLTSSLQART